MEHTFLSHLGYSFGFLAFVSAIVSGISYFFDVQNQTDDGKSLFKKIGRLAFYTHAVSVFSIVGLLFFLLLSHYYEFNYKCTKFCSMDFELICVYRPLKI